MKVIYYNKLNKVQKVGVWALFAVGVSTFTASILFPVALFVAYVINSI